MRCPREGFAFWLVFGPAVLILCFCLAATCRGQGGAFTAPGGMYDVIDGRAVLNPGWQPAQGCGPGGCPGGSCPIPQPPRWQTPRRPAAEAPQAPPNPAVCRIRNQMARQGSLGSGTVVDTGGGYALVLTCKHLFRDGAGAITCTFPGNPTAYPGKYVADKNENDLAAILIDDPRVAPVDLAAEPLRRGEFAQSAGFGPDGRYAVNSGFVTRVDGTQFELSGAARQGDSGGPVFDAQGRLIGVLWGTDGREVIATSAATADGFLQRAGRYLLPWNAKINDPARDPRNRPPVVQPPQVVVQPPQQGRCPQVDLAPIEAALGDLDRRQSALEARQDKVRDTAEALAAKYEAKLPGITADLQKAIDGSKTAKDAADAAKGDVAAALSDEGPKSLLGRVKARLDERLGDVFATLPWLKYGLIALAVALGYLFLRKEGEKAAAGQPTLWQRAAALTPTDIDDKIAAKVAAGQAALHERLASLHGSVANLAGSVSALAQNQQNQKPPAPPATGG